MQKIIVIIVTYNAMKWVDRCFSSLESSTICPDVFVVDNGSSDGTQSYIAENFPAVIFRQNPANWGFGRANNIGLKYAIEHEYEYVYLLNQDAWVNPDTFENLIGLFERNPAYGIISPSQLNTPNAVDRNFLNYVPKDLTSDLLLGNELKELYEISFANAAHWMLTRKALLTIGGFSPAFKHYGEDDDYLNRATYLGFKIGLAPHEFVIHDRGLRPEPTKDQRFYFAEVEALVSINNINLPAKTIFIQPLRYFIFARKLFFFKAVIRTIRFYLEAPYYIKCRHKSKSFAFLD